MEKIKDNNDGKANLLYHKKANKVSNRLKDAHCKIALFLAKNYDVILCPDFLVKGMTGRGGRIGKNNRKNMLYWSHYAFKQRLRNACEKYGKILLDTKEYYTSKTCSLCHRFNDVGSSKIYKCKYCNLTTGRDMNGAVNNLLIHLI